MFFPDFFGVDLLIINWHAPNLLESFYLAGKILGIDVYKRQHIDRIYVCPHDKGTCHCRKPEIGLFLQAQNEYNIDKNHSYMVGDSVTDIQAGKKFGISTISINGLNYGADYDCSSLMEAAKWIIRGEEK